MTSFPDDNNSDEAPQAAPVPNGSRLSLGSVMVLIAVVGVGLAIARDVPGLGVPLLLVMVPAQLRTTLRISRGRALGRPLSFTEKVDEYLTSVGITILILVASGIAFVGTCFPLGLMTFRLGGKGPEAPLPFPVVVPWIVGAGSALLVFFLLGRRFWPHKKDPS